jgi:ribosomal protein L11 methyltransferase
MISATLTPAATTVARLETSEQNAHRIADAVGERFDADDVAVSIAGEAGGVWQVAIHFRAAPDEMALRALVAATAGAPAAATLQFAAVAAADWVRTSLDGLAPVAAGRFVVHGAHDRARIPPNRIGIEIEAALAFGTGHHGTTRGCLLALDRVCKSARTSGRKPSRILDVGTGSGVLAIAAARALLTRVLATDIDPDAVRVARDNARLNRAGALVEVIAAAGVNAHRIGARAPFDLVFANILLGPLQRLALPLRRLVAPGGRIVLSGILRAQANAAIASYRPLVLERRIDLDGWTTLIFVRGAPQHRAIHRIIDRAVARTAPRT